ncbi:MAG: ABC transporter ATP-binding protein [Bacteroidales bacterium]|nr:ABC transporter ATP-binding protein [Bacteroidales bacterium]
MSGYKTIELINLTTGYHHGKKGIVITKEINASLFSGQMVCLLGPNGAGKSTLLKTLSNFIPPLDGEIFIKGKNLNGYSDSEIAREIGVVLTEKPNLQNMTVEQLVGMGRSPYTNFWGKLRAKDRNIVSDALDAVGMLAFKHRLFQNLSDGERQKVMIAKALAQETPVIFLDEPTAFIDFPGKVEMMKLLATLAHEKDKTIFLSTHDLELALLYADKLWLIDRLHGLTTGTPADLAANGAMSLYFPGVASLMDSIKTLPEIV